MMKDTLDNLNVLVTGAASGIGQAVAEAFAKEGANLALADIKPLQPTESILDNYGANYISANVDISNEESVSMFVNKTAAELGNPDIAIHCAGVIHQKELIDTTMADFDRVMSVNLRGTFLFGREILRRMREAGEGRLINIASDLSYIGREEFSVYCASKAAVLSLTRSWALEFAPHILINAICPGPINTAMLAAEHMSPEWREKELDIPLKRFGEASEIAATAVFLAGPGARFITGQGIGVNGGSVMC